jgi:hypothetical protein
MDRAATVEACVPIAAMDADGHQHQRHEGLVSSNSEIMSDAKSR